MPSPYAERASRLKAEIVARLAAGEPLNAICAPSGVPAVATVRNWTRTDLNFGEAVAAARQRAAWRRAAFDEARASAFLARARSGETIRSLLGQPGMPSQLEYRHWKATQAPFAEAALALRQARDARGRTWGQARRKDFDQAIADRIIVRLNTGPGLKVLLKDDPTLPSREVVARWRREQPEFDGVLRMMIAAKRRIMPPVPEALVQDVVDHIVEGGAFLSYSRLPDSPGYNTLRRWMRDPDFARDVAQACEWREHWYADQIQIAGDPTAPGSVQARGRSIGQLKRQIVRLRHRPTKPLPPERRRDRERPPS